ncbi:hypothetical protein [Alcanivorax sp. DP30]|uniref:hypothetical protein n=1 Tax=Alcanivorax sp. DP30 TaxID=2606217 RepID=UPI00137145AC|nr:hypothetical protein [Alcanivorax sp. DP30]MZR63560.1 hypothetical protein [Alcanivorax sp. DP30]
MKTDNENALMQSLRMSATPSGELLSLPLFKGFASEDEILAAWQDGALSTAQETALKAALASSNSLRQQWLALSAAVPKTTHGAVWHGLFRWHWATIGMTASVALVGVLLFRQGQLPMMSGDSVAMQEPMAEISMNEADVAFSDALVAPKAKALGESLEKRQLTTNEAMSSGAEGFREEGAEVASAPPMADQARAPARSQPGPVAVAPPGLPSAARLAAPSAPDWQTYLQVYRGQQDAADGHDMARLARAALAVQASQCAPEDVVTLKQVFRMLAQRYPQALGPMAPDNEAGWCELGEVLERKAEELLQ